MGGFGNQSVVFFLFLACHILKKTIPLEPSVYFTFIFSKVQHTFNKLFSFNKIYIQLLKERLEKAV